MIRSSLLALAIIAVMGSASLCAQLSPEALFKRLDKNGDGGITSDELAKERQGVIAQLDLNKDGRISLDEHLKGAARRGKPADDAARKQGEVPDAITALRNLPYADTTNPRQMLDLYLPKKRSSDKPLPLVIFIHGGGWKNGSKDGGIRTLSALVTSGDYVGASIGYRLTNEAQWPAQIHDCKAGIRWLRAHAKEHGIDPDHIAVWGTSAGGHLVSMLGTSGDAPELEGRLGKHLDQPSKVQAVVNYFGPENFETMVTQESTIDRTVKDYPEALLIGGRVQDVPEAARAASPVTYITKGDAPFLTAHGTKDPLVPFAQATELHEKLRKAEVPSLLMTMKDGGHGFKSQALDRIVTRFLDQQLRGVAAELKDETLVPEAGK